VTALRVATRGSQQALTQARAVADALVAAHPGRPVELVTIETTGDRRTDVPLHSIGGQGVFVKEVQQAVLDGRADVAVHSAKDLPSIPTIGLRVGAWCARRDPRDVLVGSTLASLPAGATVASGSVRRRAQLAALRPDLQFAELRGNIATRLSKVPDGGAIVMAAAALEILGMTDRVAEALDPDVMVPAVGQGIVAVEHRDDDADTAGLVAAIDHASSRHAVEVERAFLAELGSGCSLPVGGYCDGRTLRVFLAGERTIARRTIGVAGAPSDVLAAASLARELHAEVAG
jgi:hydroxymethylbilane synthase